MSAQSEFHAALESGDIKLLRKASALLFPHLPQATSDAEAEIQLHMARTQMGSIDFRKRAYSHAWLIERGLPSQLPDDLKPKAERLYPRVVEAVFVSANSNSAIIKPAVKLVQKAMSDAVEDAYAEGRTEPAFVRERIQDARKSEIKKLFGMGVK
jgi:hypothetical protein